MPSLAPGDASRRSVADQQVPLWIKLLYGLFLCVLVPVYWHHNGPANFLWASDIALLVVFVALCLESPLLNSMMAVGVLPFEIFWVVDFLSGSRLIGITAYMFGDDPLYLRGLSFFHLFLPVVMIFLLRRLGYDRRALAAQTLLIWIVLPVTYLLTDPQDNINLVFGFSPEPQTAMHPLLHLLMEMLLVPVVVCWPAHRVLRRLFGHRVMRGELP